VEPQHETAEPEQPKAETPIVDSAEENVKDTLTANDLDTSHLLIVRYGDVIRVEPQPGFPDKWGNYEEDPAPRKQVEAEAKPVEPQKNEAAEPEQPRAETPIVDSAEENVKDTLTANDLDTDRLLIVRYGDVIRVEPQPGFPDKWGDYDRVLKFLKAKWSDETLRWEVPAKDQEHLADSPALEPEEPVYDLWAIEWKLKGGEPAPRDTEWAWAFAYNQDGDYIPELKPRVQYLEQYGALEDQGYTVTLGGRDKNLLNLKKNKEEAKAK
ncbi:MAG: hypothetical protein V1924_06350, partial [Candidatus Bathyarchaeota archaeon]